MKELQVIPLSDIQIGNELGRGAYGRVFKVKYLETYYAAKQIHSLILEYGGQAETARIRENFMREIQLCNALSHPNIVQYRGIFFLGGDRSSDLPVMLMELMDNSLSSYLTGQIYVGSKTKISILHDISLGLYYLHSQKPPIIHRDLSANNIMIKNSLPQPIAKISDMGVASILQDDSKDSRDTMTRAPGTVDYMPPECLATRPIYGTPVDVFSYGAIALFVINQKWPDAAEQIRFDPITGELKAYTEFERRLKHFNFQDSSLKQLIAECLSNDPGARPSARRIATFLSDFKSYKEEILTQAVKIFITREDKDDEMVIIKSHIYSGDVW